MASGRLGASTPAATTYTALYTVPSSKVASFSVSVCNRNSSSATFRLALSTATTPSNGEFLEYDYTLTAAGTPGASFERTGLVADEGKVVSIYASTTGLDFVAYGFEA